MLRIILCFLVLLTFGSCCFAMIIQWSSGSSSNEASDNHHTALNRHRPESSLGIPIATHQQTVSKTIFMIAVSFMGSNTEEEAQCKLYLEDLLCFLQSYHIKLYHLWYPRARVHPNNDLFFSLIREKTTSFKTGRIHSDYASNYPTRPVSLLFLSIRTLISMIYDNNFVIYCKTRLLDAMN
jgi:hypothetical protein